MSPSRTLALTLILYLSLLVAFVNAHDDPLQQRAHHDYNMKRAMMRKRAPLPQGSDGPVVGAGPLPVVEPTSTSSSRGVPESSSSPSTVPTPSSTTSESRVLSFSGSSVPPSSVSPRPTSRSLSASSSPPPQITSTTDDGAGGVSTILVPGVTRISSVPASESSVPDKQGNSSSSQVKSTTLTVLIAIAASVGGIFILWTIFRKWKLSSSKDFDRRLNPIDWQPTTGGEDDQIPGLARRPSIGSLHSSGHGHGATGISRAPSDQGHSNPFDDFDHPAVPSQHPVPVQVGGYADLARGSSPTQMQQRNRGGPSYAHGVTPLPLHHHAGY